MRSVVRRFPKGLLAAVAGLTLAAPAAFAASPVDPSFGTNGSVLFPKRQAYISDMAVFSGGPHAGDIVTVGGSGDMVLSPDVHVRNGDGSPDARFRGGPGVGLRFPGTYPQGGVGGQQWRSVAIDGAGKVLVIGSSWPADLLGGRTILARLGTDGRLDTETDSDPGVAFGPGGTGYVPVNGGTEIAVIETGPDEGDLLVAGDSRLTKLTSDGIVNWQTNFRLGTAPAQPMYVDSSFVSSVLPLPNGGAVVSGLQYLRESQDVDSPTRQELGVVRFNPDGSLDTAFGDAGRYVVDGVNWAGGMARGPDGRFTLSLFTPAGEAHFLRLTQNGQPAPDFGDDGLVPVSVPTLASGFAGLVVTEDHIYTSGAARRENGWSLAAVRFTEDGRLDPEFGVAGVALAADPIDSWSAGPVDLALDGRGDSWRGSTPPTPRSRRAYRR